eukprot:5243447-Amphidinium_carterae.1
MLRTGSGGSLREGSGECIQGLGPIQDLGGGSRCASSGDSKRESRLLGCRKSGRTICPRLWRASHPSP